MSWADKFKNEQIVVNTTKGHNKFWAAVMDPLTHNVKVRWGRIGTKGQQKDFPHSSEWGAADFITTRLREQTRKGYRGVTKQEFDELSIQAAVVGTNNKCNVFEWVELSGDGAFKKITPDRLAAPDCNPGVYVVLETKKQFIPGMNSYRLLFSFDKAHLLVPPMTLVSPDCKYYGQITKGHQLYELTQKVEEALGRSLSG